MLRWEFYDPLTDETYTFPVNPNDGGTPEMQKKVGYQSTAAPDGTLIAYEGRDEAQQSEFSGTILYREQYEALMAWFGKRHVVQCTDDLGRIFMLYIIDFRAQRQRASQYPWKHSYTVKALVMSMSMPA